MTVLEKQKWRINKKEKGLCRDIIESKYKFWRKLNNCKKCSSESRLLRDLRKQKKSTRYTRTKRTSGQRKERTIDYIWTNLIKEGDREGG